MNIGPCLIYNKLRIKVELIYNEHSRTIKNVRYNREKYPDILLFGTIA
jgi:hypothetical protein